MRPKKDLSEKDFIAPEPKKMRDAWVHLFALLGLVALTLVIGTCRFQPRKENLKMTPFLRVTNREMSVFLWQHPQFMRLNQKKKTGYLTGFPSKENACPDPDQADDYVVAPPELLFRYHTWDRLLGKITWDRPIPPTSFEAFLEQCPEWIPQHWPSSSQAYKNWFETGEWRQWSDLQKASYQELPLIIRQAYLGWKNFHEEGEEINQMQWTAEDLRFFQKKHPEYAVHLWKNLFPGPLHYLANLKEKTTQETPIPPQDLPPFLRVALYNDANL